MAKKTIEDTAASLALPIVGNMAFELVDVEFVKEAGNWYLRVYIDKPGGITIDDCQAVSEKLSCELDKVDPIKHGYILEVSSPGLERTLKKESDFEKYKGNAVEVRLFEPLNGRKVFEGELAGLKDGKILVRASGNEILEFDRSRVSSVRTVAKF